MAVVSRTDEMNMIASGIYPYLALSVNPCRGLTDLLRPMGGRKFAQHPVGADAHIGPLGSYEFAEEFCKNSIFRGRTESSASTGDEKIETLM